VVSLTKEIVEETVLDVSDEELDDELLVSAVVLEVPSCDPIDALAFNSMPI
jgi:hypothetical protein